MTTNIPHDAFNRTEIPESNNTVSKNLDSTTEYPAGVSPNLKPENTDKHEGARLLFFGVPGSLLKLTGTVAGLTTKIFGNYVAAFFATVCSLGASDALLGIAIGEAPEKGNLLERAWKGLKAEYFDHLETMRNFGGGSFRPGRMSR